MKANITEKKTDGEDKDGSWMDKCIVGWVDEWNSEGGKMNKYGWMEG